MSIALDTTAPVLSIEAPSSVEPPDELHLVLRANEPLGPVSVALLDSLGVLTQLGFERVDATTVRVVAPTVGLASGRAELLFSVADEVLNVTQRTVVVDVGRPRGFDVELSFDRAFDVELSNERGFEVNLQLLRAFEVELGRERAFEVELSFERAFDVEFMRW